MFVSFFGNCGSRRLLFHVSIYVLIAFTVLIVFTANFIFNKNESSTYHASSSETYLGFIWGFL